MRILTFLLAALFGFIPLQAEEVYFFQPDWHFTFSGPVGFSLIYPGAKPESAHFKNFEIVKKLPSGKYWGVGTIERPGNLSEALTLTYILDTPSIGRGKAVARFFSMGTLMSSMREFDIYDFQDRPIGYIGGEYFTDQAVKFVCYDADDEPKAIAMLDRKWETLTVVDAQDEERVLAIAEKVFFITWEEEIYYFWKVTVDDEDKILDPRLLWPVITLVADYYWRT